MAGMPVIHEGGRMGGIARDVHGRQSRQPLRLALLGTSPYTGEAFGTRAAALAPLCKGDRAPEKQHSVLFLARSGR